MRCVDYDPSDVEMPENTGQIIQQLLDANNDNERSEIIRQNGGIWATVKPQLCNIFHGKCWYTEAPQQGTDVDVDHFRPKKRIAELRNSDAQHPGYWWLSFSPENYRYSCIVANRRRRDVSTGHVGGKSDHFPIFDETKRAWTPACDCSEEEPKLLDPCVPADVGFLTFRENGEAMPRFNKEAHTKAYERAVVSIEFYHLNHTDFVKARIALRDEMSKLVNSAKRAFSKLDPGDAFHSDAYKQAIASLRKMIKESAPYSSFCIAILDQYRNDDFLSGVFR